MPLTPGYQALAERLQEASAITHSNVRSRLQDALSDAHKGTGDYANYVDHTGDGTTGDCIYSCNGNMKKAPYTLGEVGGKKTANVDTENAKDVVPTVSYDEEADDADHMASMFESQKLYTKTPIFERFIPQSERDKADGSSFAGKGKSFPILKPGDVKAAVHAMGRAGSGNYGMAQLKANIKKIAKSKGWESELPDAWKGDDDSSDAKESTGTKVPRETLLVESGAHFLDEIPLLESARQTDYDVKLIQPGRGSSGYYTPEVLQRDGPKIFTPGTQMFWNHATAAQESARPEGDMNDLAAVLTTGARYEENGKDGAGLYARAKVFADYADRVADKAPHTGLSIRAYGASESAKKAPDGKPGLIAALTRAESVDFVTKAGAGGKLFTESKHTEGDEEMPAEEMRKLQESVSVALRLAAVSEARLMIAEELAEIKGFPKAAVNKLKESLIVSIPTTATGELDKKAFKTLVEAGIQTEALYLREVTGGAHVTGLGAAPTVKLSVSEQAKVDKDRKRELKEHAKRLGFKTKAGRRVYLEGRSAFDVNYNSADEGVLVGAVED